MESSLTLEEAQKFVKSKKHLYKAMQRNDDMLKKRQKKIKMVKISEQDLK